MVVFELFWTKFEKWKLKDLCEISPIIKELKRSLKTQRSHKFFKEESDLMVMIYLTLNFYSNTMSSIEKRLSCVCSDITMETDFWSGYFETSKHKGLSIRHRVRAKIRYSDKTAWQQTFDVEEYEFNWLNIGVSKG